MVLEGREGKSPTVPFVIPVRCWRNRYLCLIRNDQSTYAFLMIHPTDSTTQKNHHLQNENGPKILQGVWTADFGSDWWIFNNIVPPCFSSLALDATRISNVLCRSRCSANRRIYTIYPPLNKHSTWKSIVGRWKFLLRWPIFSCELLVFRELF